MDVGNLKLILIMIIVPWIVFVIAVKTGKQRFFNSLLLMFNIMWTVMLLILLTGKNALGIALVLLLVMVLVLLVVPFFLMYNGVVMMRREGRSTANMLSLLMGVAILIGEVAFIFFHLRLSLGKPMTFFDKITGLVGYSALYFCLVFLAFLMYAVFVTIMPHRHEYAYIIIHGCGLIDGERVSPLLAARIDAALKAADRCRKSVPIFIPSGGKGSDEAVSEAHAMGDYLRGKGITDDRIIEEDRSPNTEDNLRNSKAIIEQRGGGRVALVTSNYHVYRCLTLAKKLRLDCTGIGAPVAGYFWPSALIREFVAVFSTRKNVTVLIVFWACLMALLITAMW